MGKARSDADPADARAIARSVLEAEARAVTHAIDHLDDALDHAVVMLFAATGTVIVSGMGKSGLIARKVSATLASTGTPSHYLHPSDAMHGDLGRLRPNDLLLLLSYGGETEEVLALAALARQDRVKVIALTGKPDNHLARISDVCLCIGDVTEACPHNLAPTASTTAMLALGDAVAMAVSARRSFSAEDFAKRHPGGQLGRQLMPIAQALRFRAGENLPLIRSGRTVAQVLREASAAAGAGPRRAGAVVVVDDEGRLAGIFTDGDLRRLLADAGPAVLDRAIDAVMTVQPITLADDALVRDAVQIMRERRLDEIPVVDPTGKPVGLVDVQDLVAMRVVES